MNIFSLLANLSTIINLVHTVQLLIEGVIQNKKVPSIADVLPLLDEVEKIFSSGVIVIKGVDDKQVADAIQLIRDELVKATGGVSSTPAP